MTLEKVIDVCYIKIIIYVINVEGFGRADGKYAEGGRYWLS